MQEGYITPKEKKLPEVEVVLHAESSTGERFWMVERCPYCGKKHRHGAGTQGENPRSYLGHHPSQCTRKYPSDRGYVLIEKH